jgi:hypothetical protein
MSTLYAFAVPTSMFTLLRLRSCSRAAIHWIQSEFAMQATEGRVPQKVSDYCFVNRSERLVSFYTTGHFPFICLYILTF